jgi:hypothetical protein
MKKKIRISKKAGLIFGMTCVGCGNKWNAISVLPRFDIAFQKEFKTNKGETVPSLYEVEFGWLIFYFGIKIGKDML